MNERIGFRASPSAQNLVDLAMFRSGAESYKQLIMPLVWAHIMKGCPPLTLLSLAQEKDLDLVDKIEQAMLKCGKEGITFAHPLAQEKFVKRLREEVDFDRRKSNARYYVCLPDRILGPHRLERLQEWVALGLIPQDWPARQPEAKSTVALENIPGFFDFGPTLRKRLEESKEHPQWWNDSVTKAQLRKLEFFRLPYPREGLTRGIASQFIECFVMLDPQSNKGYKEQKEADQKARREKRATERSKDKN